MCGADFQKSTPTLSRLGSPPRVRSRLQVAVDIDRVRGITSACAEQTRSVGNTHADDWDHLRVCGADSTVPCCIQNPPGSPPRVRSRRKPERETLPYDRITSACAEQTNPDRPAVAAAWDHLRVCGADAWLIPRSVPNTGSPPRVRSRLLWHRWYYVDGRITSACAEQTLGVRPRRASTWDHLRVCGADSCILLCSEPAEWRGIFDLRTA